MKLYTESDLNKAMLEYIQGKTRYEIINSLTPIELPSDEDILEDLTPLTPQSKGFYIEQRLFGAKWMRDKIQGGNK